MTIQTMNEAIPYLYSSLLRAQPHHIAENDAITRAPHLTRKLLETLNLLPPKEKTILVTGSKGKGSTSRMIAAILRRLGYKVGLFTSPHLIHYNERIRINGKAISDEKFLYFMNSHAPAIDDITGRIENPKHYLGPTGILLSIALAHFKEEQTDINVIEIGRGGTYDDTNVLENKWAIISKVMEEHVGYLGNTIYDIVSHKTGIVKSMTDHVIIGKQTNDVMTYIKSKLSIEASYYGADFIPSLLRSDLSGSYFDCLMSKSNYENLFLPLLGSFQTENAALAIQACETIVKSAIPVNVIQESLESLKWPGRLEVISKDPYIILDGTINRVSAEYIKEMLPLVDSKKVATIIAVPENKDYEGVIQVCSKFSHILVVTTPEHSHKNFPKDALEVARKYHAAAQETKLLSKAIDLVMQEKATTIFIVGTQSMIGSAKEIWKDSLMDIG